MIKTTLLEGKELRERFKKLSKPINEVVSQVQPTKYHDRVSPTSRILQTFHKQNDSIEDDDEEIDLQELIDEFQEEMELEDILDEMGYYDEEEEDLDELKSSGVTKGYKEGRDLVMKLRSGLFKKLNDEELDDFMDVLSRSFDMIRR